MSALPPPAPGVLTYETTSGLTITRSVEAIAYPDATAPLIDALDTRPGVLLASTYEYPGRYTRYDLGFTDPALVLTGSGRRVTLAALTARGRVLEPAVRAALDRHPHLRPLAPGAWEVMPVSSPFPEEERSQQPSLFSAVRAMAGLFAAPYDAHLGLYGAFGYDIALGFEGIAAAKPRPADHRDMVLYLPDALVVVDHAARVARRLSYDFALPAGAGTTHALPRDAAPPAPQGRGGRGGNSAGDDMAPGAYAALVREALPRFACGDLFEVVPSRVFRRPVHTAPSELFRRLSRRNPAPYGFLINLGQGEHLVGASPEMYVRVTGDRVETCPISGTIARGRDALEDADAIRTLLTSAKEEAELTMCTDVDRNDKARVCQPGSIRILGRRQIEMYSRLIHTVDHVEGQLRPGFDALDAFLSHCWAVTVTGAPKRAAMSWLEAREPSPRAWYGGAVGMLGFDGGMNTGLTLRTIRLKDGVAEVRAGATLLAASDPQAEEAETELKASAMIDVLERPDRPAGRAVGSQPAPGKGFRVLLLDHEDSFVHMLASTLRATGAEVITWRGGLTEALLDAQRPDVVVLSPGPGTPAAFGVPDSVGVAVARGLPVFGVCLGLQGIVEHFGGRLGQLLVPAHGVAAAIRLDARDPLFSGLPETVTVGRYHSLHAAALPDCLQATAWTADGVVMAVRHRTLPVHGVQFHPESLMSLREEAGARMVGNLFRHLAA